MKLKILKLSLIFLAFAVTTVGCQDEKDLFELQIGDENAVILKEIEGIEFKFCLLNEQGDPSTIFEEGENFTFQFAIKNNLDTTINWDNNLFFSSEFCEVKDGKNKFGPPFKIMGMAEIGQVAFSIPPGIASVWEVPWVPDENEWTKGFVSYKRNNLQYLPKGKYYTRFSRKFDLGPVETQVLTFKINFEIK